MHTQSEVTIKHSDMDLSSKLEETGKTLDKNVM